MALSERVIKTAETFGILEKMQALENDLLKIGGISECNFSIDNFWNGFATNHVILVPKYSIPSKLPVGDYFAARRKQLQEIIDVCKQHDLTTTGDIIEDHGEHWYIVRKCGNTWKPKKEAIL